MNNKKELNLVNFDNMAYNAETKETIMQKETSISIEQKRRAVLEITQKHEDQGVPIPEACKAQGIKVYTYYNWKKRVEQLAIRKKVKPIIHQFPIKQSANPATIVLPKQESQKCIVIMTDTADLNRVLQQLL